MAHLRKLEKLKCKACGRKAATVELFNARNASNGVYCGYCGRNALRVLKKIEEEGRG